MISPLASVSDARSYSPLPRIPVQPSRPALCDDTEIGTILRLLHGMRPRPASVVIGRAADEVSHANAARIADAWTGRGGLVLATVAWPETAASWLRQARRFAAPDPDAWIVTATPAGWIGMGRRLVCSTEWSPQRTIATSGLAVPALIQAGGIGTFDGLRGAHADGGSWEIVRTLLVDHPGSPQ
ncbi:hypothetical protein [Amycolatopsis alba]|uniref:hypothetical protein n=1 Tax=Amycolatopsis alba TaxID=76020 RepID=UPI001FD80230|nr:hypothetical protein [Amycolatopsis alba]